MVLEKEILSFYEWLLPSMQGMGALLQFVVIAAGLTVVAVFIAYLRMAILQGPGEGFYAVAKAIATAVSSDFPRTTLGRIWAMARLAIQEALRRRVLVAFAVFAVVLLFAGWFLDTRSDHPARLYLSFVLTATERLVLILAVMLAAFSLPNDIKFHTIYTVVTKPVRATEIILGRIVGFTLINTAILVLMGVVSYFFVVRGLSHTHVVEVETLEQIRSGDGQLQAVRGETNQEDYHRHEFTLEAQADTARSDMVMDHFHVVQREGEGQDAAYRVLPPRGALVARVPVYGQLRFYDRTGRPGKGISVGKEWSYREYIEGGSQAAAAWTFTGLDKDDYVGPDAVLPLEMNLSVFRTYKGDIVSGILGAITVKNPTTGKTSEPIPFTAREFVTYQHDIPRELKELTPEGTLADVDLFHDLVDENGNVEIWIRCSEPSQYFGMAQADVYVRGQDAPFVWNFCKGYIGIWLQMVIITCFGVMFSTFLSGPVAMFATVVTYMVGLFKEFIINVATGEQVGGGPLESLIRLLTQKNVMIELDMGPLVERTVKAFDAVFMFFMWLAARVFPDYTSFNTSRFVAHGFNIDGNLLAQHCLITLAFVVVLSIFGYFFLKSREIAA
jgi:hypothetical protein